jgi:CRISPR-associated protein Cas2
MLYVISYDITDDARRVRVHAALRNYGTRVQYSVFECDLAPGQIDLLRAEVGRLVRPAEDSVRYYRLCQDCMAQTTLVGTRPLTTDPDYWIV